MDQGVFLNLFLLRYNLHITLFKFKVFNVLVVLIYLYTAIYNCHHNIS